MGWGTNMLASLIAATVLSSELDWLDHKIAFRTPGVPLSVLVKVLSTQTGRAVTVAPELEREVVAIRVDAMAAGELLAVIGEVSYGKLTISGSSAHFDLDKERIQRETEQRVKRNRATYEQAVGAVQYLSKPHTYTIDGKQEQYEPLPQYTLLAAVVPQFTPADVETALRGSLVLRSTESSSAANSLTLKNEYADMVEEAERSEEVHRGTEAEHGLAGLIRPTPRAPYRVTAELSGAESALTLQMTLRLVDKNNLVLCTHEHTMYDWALFVSFGLEAFPFPPEVMPSDAGLRGPWPSETEWPEDQQELFLSPRGQAMRFWTDPYELSDEARPLAEETARNPHLHEPTAYPWGEFVVAAAEVAKKDVIAVLPDELTGLSPSATVEPIVDRIRNVLDPLPQEFRGNTWLIYRDLPLSAMDAARASRIAAAAFLSLLAQPSWPTLDERAKLSEAVGDGHYAAQVRDQAPVMGSAMSALESASWLAAWARMNQADKDALLAGKAIPVSTLPAGVKSSLMEAVRDLEQGMPNYYFGDTLEHRQRRKLQEIGRIGMPGIEFGPRWHLRPLVEQASLVMRTVELPVLIGSAGSETTALGTEDLALVIFLGAGALGDRPLEASLADYAVGSGIVRLHTLSILTSRQVIGVGYLQEVVPDVTSKHRDPAWMKAFLEEAQAEAKRLESDPVAKLAREFPFSLAETQLDRTR